MKKFSHPKSRKSLRKISSNLLLICVLLVPALLHAASSEERQLFVYINNERLRSSLNVLTWNDELHKAALEHSVDMATTGNLAHEGSDRSLPHDRIYRQNIYVSQTAENIARDTNVVSAHTSLMMSLTHRANILNPEFTDMAVGVVRKGHSLYITQLFSRVLPAIPEREARDRILETINDFRRSRGRSPLQHSLTMANIAQSHAEDQGPSKDLDSPVVGASIGVAGVYRTNSYTTVDLKDIPEDVHRNILRGTTQIGIGFNLTRGALCESGCYVVSLVIK